MPPVPFAGLSAGAQAIAYVAIQKAYFGIDSSPISLHGRRDGIRVDKDALQIAAWENQHLNADGVDGKPAVTDSTGDWTKVAEVTPSAGAGKIDYMFDLWNTSTLTGNSIYKIPYPNIKNINVSLNTILGEDDTSKFLST